MRPRHTVSTGGTVAGSLAVAWKLAAWGARCCSGWSFTELAVLCSETLTISNPNDSNYNTVVARHQAGTA